MPALSNFITLIGIVIPKPLGYLTLSFIFIKDVIKKTTSPFLINKNYKFTSLFTLIFLFLHLVIPFLNDQFNINPEIKSIFFYTIATLIILSKKISGELKNYIQF